MDLLIQEKKIENITGEPTKIVIDDYMNIPKERKLK